MAAPWGCTEIDIQGKRRYNFDKMVRATYRFFDTAFGLETDSPAFLANLDRAYGRFRVAEDVGAPVYRVMLAGQPEVTIGGQTVHSPDAEALSLYAYNALLNDVAARVRSHFLFHAAALSTPDGAGLILAGGAGLGKTALTLALLERGFGFLSDDVAAVSRADGWLYPFPRSLGVRFPGGGPGEKQLLDVTEVASPCAVRFLFVLTDPALPAKAPPWYLVLNRAPAPLLADLRALGGVREVQVVREEPYPAIRLDLAPGTLPAAEPEIEATCRRHETLLFEVVQGHEAPPDFQGEPRLGPLSAAEAARELLHHFKGGPRSALLRDEFGGSAARLYLALADLAVGMAGYRLYVGRLAEMLALIQAACFKCET